MTLNFRLHSEFQDLLLTFPMAMTKHPEKRLKEGKVCFVPQSEATVHHGREGTETRGLRHLVTLHLQMFTSHSPFYLVQDPCPGTH